MRIFIHAGSILEKIAGDDRIHNTTVVFDRDGNEIARYRKIHMFDITAPDGTQYRESASFKPGEAIATYKADDFTFGCAICYDLRFPYLFAALAQQGRRYHRAAGGLHATHRQGPLGGSVPSPRHRDETYFCAPAQTGLHQVGSESRATYGHSLVIDPWGHVIARASDGVGIVSARIARQRVEKVRAQIPVAAHKVKLG